MYMYHGPTRNPNPAFLKKHDVILTTYQTVSFALDKQNEILKIFEDMCFRRYVAPTPGSPSHPAPLLLAHCNSGPCCRCSKSPDYSRTASSWTKATSFEITRPSNPRWAVLATTAPAFPSAAPRSNRQSRVHGVGPSASAAAGGLPTQGQPEVGHFRHADPELAHRPVQVSPCRPWGRACVTPMLSAFPHAPSHKRKA